MQHTPINVRAVPQNYTQLNIGAVPAGHALSTTDPLTSASGVDEVLGDGRQPVEVGHGEHVVGVGVVGDGLQLPGVHGGPHAH